MDYNAEIARRTKLAQETDQAKWKAQQELWDSIKADERNWLLAAKALGFFR